MVGDNRGLTHNIARAVCVDDHVSAHFAFAVCEHLERALHGGFGSVMENDAFHLVHPLSVVVRRGMVDFLICLSFSRLRFHAVGGMDGSDAGKMCGLRLSRAVVGTSRQGDGERSAEGKITYGHKRSYLMNKR